MVGETNLCCRLVLTLTAGKCHITVFRLHVAEAGGFTVELVATNLAVVVDNFPLPSHPRGFLHLLVHRVLYLPVGPYLLAVPAFKRTEAADKVGCGGVSRLDMHL